MRVLIYIGLLFPSLLPAQENFYFSHDFNGLSQAHFTITERDDYFYTIGGTVCSTGECGILSKYDIDGNLLYLIEIDNIDLNSYSALNLKEDKLQLIGLSKDTVGARLLTYDLDGILQSDHLISRDTNLVYTWPRDAYFKDNYFFLAVNENYANESRQNAIYKVDYTGKVLDFIRLPYYFRGSTLTLTELPNQNLFISFQYKDEGVCAFQHQDISSRNAVIFYEVSADLSTIVREKKSICHSPTNSVSYDCTILPNNTIIRTALWRDEMDEDIVHAANIYFDADWNEIAIEKYPQLEVGNPLASYGIVGCRTFLSQDSSHFYILASEGYPIEGEEYPYVNLFIQKWDLNRNLIWETIVSDPIIHKRLLFRTLVETNSNIVLAGYTWSDFDIGGTQDFVVMSLDLEGCFNEDCSDIIYINGPPNSTTTIALEDEITLFPNPILDRVNLNSTSIIRRVNCYSMNGELVFEKLCESYDCQLEFSGIPSGTYFLKIISDSGTTYQKVIKL